MRTFVKVLEVLEIIAGAVTLLGASLYFHGCGKANDVFLSCHWAQRAVQALAVLLIVHAVLALIMPAGRMKAGVSLAMIPTALLMSIIPRYVIDLCLDASKSCNTKLQPFALVMGLVIAGIALVHTLFAVISSRPPKPEKAKGNNLQMSSRDKKHPVQEQPADDVWVYDDPEGIE